MCAMAHKGLLFASLLEVINVVHVGCPEQGKNYLELEKKVHNKSLNLCLKRDKDGLEGALKEATKQRKLVKEEGMVFVRAPWCKAKSNFSILVDT